MDLKNKEINEIILNSKDIYNNNKKGIFFCFWYCFEKIFLFFFVNICPIIYCINLNNLLNSKIISKLQFGLLKKDFI